MSHVSTLLNRNAATHANHEALTIRPQMSTIVLSCLDARADPAHFLGLKPGELLVLRNAGGRVTPEVEAEIAVLSAMAMQMKLGSIEIIIVHHTDCGLERMANPEAREGMAAATGLDSAMLANLAISDHSVSLRDDLQRLRDSSVVPSGLEVTGLIYDTATGGLRTVFTERT